VEWHWQENPKNSEISRPNATLSTTDANRLTWQEPGGERPVTNRLSHGTAYIVAYKQGLERFVPKQVTLQRVEEHQNKPKARYSTNDKCYSESFEN
jgi:hypothetical protein